MNREVFFMRAKIVDLIRRWFQKQDFLEVETPIMVKIPGMEPYLDLFSTEFVSKNRTFRDKRYLITSPEYSMKKLLARGFQKIFTITKVFRNGEFFSEGSCNLHNPEFTMLEWYRTEADYWDVMDDTEQMIRSIALELNIDPDFYVPNWERLSVEEAFAKYTQKKTIRDLSDEDFFHMFLNEVEPHLGFERPLFLYDYPASQAALSKKKADDPFLAERFELYIKGVELCNAFSELNDPVEQRIRLIEEQGLRRKLGNEMLPIDEEFVESLSMMPRSGGNALGIDRLVMVLLGKQSIDEVLLFPWT